MFPISDVPGYPIDAIPGWSADGWMSVDIQPKIIPTLDVRYPWMSAPRITSGSLKSTAVYKPPADARPAGKA